jgi:hypothetical protein
MTDSLKPNQALFIWKLLTGRTLEEREPAKSKAKPDLKKDFQQLVDQGYLTLEQRGRSRHVVLSDKAWAWAERASPVEILKSRSSVGAEALEALINRLVPFLAERQIALASVLAAASAHDEAVVGKPSPAALWPSIERGCLSLTGGKRKERVLLSSLREQLSSVSRASLDEALLLFQRQGKLVLYREDNSAALTNEDHAAALIVGDTPRHIVYLEN